MTLLALLLLTSLHRKGKGKGKGTGWSSQATDPDAPAEKALPTFTKLKDVKPGNRSYDLVVQVRSSKAIVRVFHECVPSTGRPHLIFSCTSYSQVGEVTSESSRTEKRRSGRSVITVKCSEALVGDETGCILLSTRQHEKADLLKPGAYIVLLNVYVLRFGGWFLHSC